ncbi:hypothetical protein FJU08_17425 [Martelella alba]|uniref:HD domain-containing protein n=1 Tax=Martelella alba TaxID=2590451 RepID=A0A506U683_9HYPH|nr:hypothetical protein [Martelella alba]TPW28584.1 hypothetical protein FJU08_17425 [Martelella alba]
MELSFTRLAPEPVHSFRPNGSRMDLLAPAVEEVNFVALGDALSKIARFNGRHNGPAYSVAQHCAMGARAILNEGGNDVSAALFLLHDAHEGLFGDIVTPAQDAIAAICDQAKPGTGNVFRSSLRRLKDGWDDAIYRAAGLPSPQFWTNSQRHLVETMDRRMLREEVRALFGDTAAKRLPRTVKPKTRGAVTPWPAMAAADEWFSLLRQLIGDDHALDASHAAAAHAALNSL